MNQTQARKIAEALKALRETGVIGSDGGINLAVLSEATRTLGEGAGLQELTPEELQARQKFREKVDPFQIWENWDSPALGEVVAAMEEEHERATRERLYPLDLLLQTRAEREKVMEEYGHLSVPKNFWDARRAARLALALMTGTMTRKMAATVLGVSPFNLWNTVYDRYNIRLNLRRAPANANPADAVHRAVEYLSAKLGPQHPLIKELRRQG